MPSPSTLRAITVRMIISPALIAGSGCPCRTPLCPIATMLPQSAAGGCTRTAERLLPYVSPPDNIVPGIASYFATVCRECPAGCAR